MSGITPLSRRIVCMAALVFGVWQCAAAAYIHGKAVLAQYLLERAWSDSKSTGVVIRPWPWADTAPVARLRVRRLRIDEIVLVGDSGRTLAFGPGWAPASAPPGMVGNTIISAHRDTQFSFLRDVRIGDNIEIETRDGSFHYLVEAMRIVNADSSKLSLDNAQSKLQLVTCYPFDALMPGGALRYVVSAALLPEVSGRREIPAEFE